MFTPWTCVKYWYTIWVFFINEFILRSITFRVTWLYPEKDQGSKLAGSVNLETRLIGDWASPEAVNMSMVEWHREWIHDNM
jgi:hypothetical protein